MRRRVSNGLTILSLLPCAGAWRDVSASRQMPVLSGLPFLGRMFQSPVPGRYVRVPWWSLVALCAAMPLFRATSFIRRRRRYRRGVCPGRGYDLRATPERCPECGAAPGGTMSPAGA